MNVKAIPVATLSNFAAKSTNPEYCSRISFFVNQSP